jgi:hypothetical protein
MSFQVRDIVWKKNYVLSDASKFKICASFRQVCCGQEKVRPSVRFEVDGWAPVWGVAHQRFETRSVGSAIVFRQ